MYLLISSSTVKNSRRNEPPHVPLPNLPRRHRLTRIDATGKKTAIFDRQLLSDEAVEALIITAALRVLGELEARHSQES